MPTVSERPRLRDSVPVSRPTIDAIGRSAVGAWSLNRAAFDGLLRFLDSDRDAAAARYEDVRGRLVKLFAWRGCMSPEEYADRTIDRVARRLAEGAEVRVTDPYQYFYGVALNLLREHGRERARQRQALESVAGEAAQARATGGGDDEGRAAFERALACLATCVDCLPARARGLLLAYHAGPGQIARRRELAASLGIPIGALRIRVHRIRVAVERCVVQRVNRP